MAPDSTGDIALLEGYERETKALAELLTPRRRDRIEGVLAHRTSNVCLVLEDLADPFNISACLRTAEAFGLQYVQVIEPVGTIGIASGVSQRAEKWLSIGRTKDPENAARFLRERGFRLLVSTPDPGPPSLSEMSLACPVALAFGNEQKGISATLARFASDRFHIPMVGFSESVNVTVAVAVSLRELFLSSWKRELLPGLERSRLRLEWYRASISPRVLATLGTPPRPASPQAPEGRP